MPKVETGEYQGRPVAGENGKFAQLGLSKRKGTKQVLIMFEITDGPAKGKVLPWFGYLTADSVERTVAALRLCGFEGQDIFDVENQKLTETVSLSVENEPFEGKIQSRVAWVNDPSYVPQIEISAMGESDRAALKKMLKGIL